MAEDLFPSPHPLTPPHCEEVRFQWIRLMRSRRVGPSTFHRLIGEHGSAAAALDALPEVARAAGVKDYEICPEPVVAAEIRAARAAGAEFVAFGSRAYPESLASLPDAPPFFWALGDCRLLSKPMIALVGARNASSLGTRMARKLAAGLGEAGYGVVSGLARGIDTAAHVAALDYGTIAVMAGGVDVIYPAENATLAREMGERGLLISEQPMGLQPHARHFPQRNRLISGLAVALVVVEAAARSGSLGTARLALEQGRDVLAVPGHPFDARAAGCNMLLREGATLVRGPRDILDAVPSSPTRAAPSAKAHAPPSPAGSTSRHGRRQPEPAVPPHELRKRILELLNPAPLPEDQLIRDLNQPAQAISPELSMLELAGEVRRHPGGMISLAGGPAS